MRHTQTASIDRLPPAPDLRLIDPLVVDRTRFNADRSHRFTLFRRWPGGDPDNPLVVIGMNPSGADEAAGDRTVNKCCGYARRWGFGGLYMLNAMSVRLTNSTDLASIPCVNLPENDRWIRSIVRDASLVVVAWGNPGGVFERGAAVETILRDECLASAVRCFGKNRNGSPVHPLYQRNDAVLVPYF